MWSSRRRFPRYQRRTMHKNLYPVPESFAVAAQVKHADYERMYAESLEDPDRFWGQIGRRIDWIQEFSRGKDSNFADDDCHVRWSSPRTKDFAAASAYRSNTKSMAR